MGNAVKAVFGPKELSPASAAPRLHKQLRQQRVPGPQIDPHLVYPKRATSGCFETLFGRATTWALSPRPTRSS